jgi:hypothetical protein
MCAGVVAFFLRAGIAFMREGVTVSFWPFRLVDLFSEGLLTPVSLRGHSAGLGPKTREGVWSWLGLILWRDHGDPTPFPRCSF